MEFPDEILLKIMGYMSTADILTKMARVSKRFNRLSQDQSLIKRIEFKSFELTFGRRTRSWTDERMEKFYNDFLEVLKNAQKLKFLSLRFEPSMEEIINRIINLLCLANYKVYEYLEEFSIQTNDRFRLNEFNHRRCPKLKILKLENTSVEEEIVSWNLASITINNSRSLQELHLNFYGTHCNEIILHFSLTRIAENMPQLQYVSIAYNSRATQLFSTAIAQQRIFQEIVSKKKLRIQIRDIRYGVHGVGGIIEFFGPANKFLMSIRRALI